LLLARFLIGVLALLAGILALLAGVLVLTAHSGVSHFERRNQPIPEPGMFPEITGSGSVIPWRRCVAAMAMGRRLQNATKEGWISPHLRHRTLLPPAVPTC
jgi:hypothetical protein